MLAVSEQDIIKHETARAASGPRSDTFQHPSKKSRCRYQSYDRKDNQQSGYSSTQSQQPWHQFFGRGRGRTLIFPSLDVVGNNINDNQFLPDPQVQCFFKIKGSQSVKITRNCKLACCAPSVTGQSQRKDLSPSISKVKIKFVKGIHYVNHCLSAPVVTNVHHVVRNPPVGNRLQKFWQVWLSLGSNMRLVSILRDRYNLPYKVRSLLTRSPLIVSGYAKPIKNKHLRDALQALLQKQAVEKV